MNVKSMVPGLKHGNLERPPLRTALDSFFENWYDGDLDGFGDSDWNGFKPQLDVADNKKKIVVTAELPGMTQEDIEIQLDGNRLFIKGEKSEEEKEEKKNYFRRECRYGAFQRIIPLPAEVIGDKVKAKFKNGVLKVTLPKTAKARKKNHRIAIDAAN